MTLEESIKIKQDYHDRFSKHMLSNERKADELSIEAMKARIRDRAFGYVDLDDLLPGETKE